MDLFDEEEIYDDLGGGIEGEADEDGDGARGDVAGVGCGEDGSHGGEEPGDDVEGYDEPTGVVDTPKTGVGGLATKEDRHNGDGEEGN